MEELEEALEGSGGGEEAAAEDGELLPIVRELADMPFYRPDAAARVPSGRMPA